MESTFYPFVPTDPEAAFHAAFPQARQLIAIEGFYAGDDRSLLEKWVDEKVAPAVERAGDVVKKGLVACLEPRNTAGLALSAATLDFIDGLLPLYPSGLAQVVAALVVVVAYELRRRGLL